MEVNFFELARMSASEREKLSRRRGLNLTELIGKVTPIIEAVRNRGDDAVREFTRTFDGVDLEPSEFRVRSEELSEALHGLPQDLREAMDVSIGNIRRFHERQREALSWDMEISPGIIAGEKVLPISSVGLYVPRGKGSFPSMMMMAGIPATVAGVERIVVVTPPDVRGKGDAATLAAAAMLGLTEVYTVGGVQAVAALAFGTETIPRVDKIVGPGSGYVLAAKQVLSTEVDTGLPAGPSEAIVFADGSTDPVTAVTDLLIEAEHGPDSSAYLVTTDEYMAKQCLELIPVFVAKLPAERRNFCTTVFRENGGVVLAGSNEEAIAFINDFAPEHLQLLVENPEDFLAKIRFAGEVLMGSFTPGTLANYSIGPNAILPTSGFARTGSALSVRDFTRRMSFAQVDKEGFFRLAPKTLVLAQYEGFAAHAAALSHRLDRKE
jgi:histidinol dehydrogenase